MGNSHEDIDVDSTGNIYVSVSGDPKHPEDLKGIQVYSPDEGYLRNVKGVPTTLHGLVLKKEKGGDCRYVSSQPGDGDHNDVGWSGPSHD